jgi:hypothetical protein
LASPFDAQTDRFLIDHVVVVVEDLEAAVGDFAELGFRVTPGGVHAGGLTRNALILLQDGTYVELLGFTVPLRALETVRLVTPLDRRLAPRGRAGEGLRDLALGARDLEIVCDALRASGLDVAGPLPGSRTRPDGTELRWRLAFPEDPRLPFLIEDITPRHLRVPGGDAVRHSNDTTGLAELLLHVDDFDLTCQRFERLLGGAPRLGGGTAEYQLANGVLSLKTGDPATGVNGIRFSSARSGAGKEVLCRGVRLYMGSRE